MRETAAERASHAYRIVSDMTPNHGQQLTERIVDHRFVECSVAHARADRQRLAIVTHRVEVGNFVDIDKVRRLGEPKRHDRDKALPTLSLIHISEPTRLLSISYAVF